MTTASRTTDPRDRWDLSVLYDDDEAYARARSRFEARFERVRGYVGRLGESASALKEALDLIYDLRRELIRLYSYAEMRSDLDTRHAGNLGRLQEIKALSTVFDGAVSFVRPEILALDEALVRRFLGGEQGLAPYAHAIDDILRGRPHTLTPPEEKLLADSGVMAHGPQETYKILTNADLPWPRIALSTGEEVRLDQAGYQRYRVLPDRTDREAVFRAFFGALAAFERTCGVTLDAEVRKNVFFARARRYGSAREASLDAGRVPVAVYDAMISAANEGLPTLHRYLRVRSRILGIPDLAYHDLYNPLVPEVERPYGLDEARALVLEVLAPLGPAYTDRLRRGFAERWVDAWPTTGKKNGAYSNGDIYGEHPFILMNYNEKFDDVSTLAHECGHAMHSWLANEAQPFPTALYSIFVAEVASTFNEALLFRRAIDSAPSDGERLSLLSQWLDAYRTTFFRQAMFAEFEAAVAARSEKGETLTGEGLSALYLDLARRYYGHSSGVCRVDDGYGVEWAYIPHFYLNFYVFQYATGFAASTALAARVASGQDGAAARYLDFLKAGGSDYPYELLRGAGIDLAEGGPYREMLAGMESTLDAVEEILERRGKGR